MPNDSNYKSKKCLENIKIKGKKNKKFKWKCYRDKNIIVY